MIEISFPFFNVSFKLASAPFSVCIVVENKASLIKSRTDLHLERIDDVLVFYNETACEYWNKDRIRFIDSLLFIDPNDKKNLAALAKQLKKIYSLELNNCSDIIFKMLSNSFKQIRLDYDLDLVSDISLKSDDTLKMMNISINRTDQTLLQRIIQYMKVSIELSGIKVFITHHLNIYLSNQEINRLIHETQLMGVSLVNFESSQNSNLLFDKNLIFDNDFSAIE